MASKYDQYVHRLDRGPFAGRYIVCVHDGNVGWLSNNTVEDPGAGFQRKAAGYHALAELDIRTYAGIGAAVRAAVRLYDLNRDAKAA